jgi:anti-sigma regulatory factor (Ser/Thr protein kinase)
LAALVEGELRWIELPAELGALPAADAFVLTAARDARIAEERLWRLQLAVEEAVVNVLRYAYPPGENGTVRIGCAATAGRLLVTIRDQGRPFDPLALEEPDVTGPIEERSIGGLGVFLLRQMVEALTYRRAEGMNQLTFQFVATSPLAAAAPGPFPAEKESAP